MERNVIILEVNVIDKEKIVEVWLTKAESQDQNLRESLKDLYAEYKKKKYMVAVFESGNRDLYQDTRDLLLYNRRRLAELEVRRQRQNNTQPIQAPSKSVRCSRDLER